MSEPRVSHSIPVSTRVLQQIRAEAAEETALQVESEEDLNQFFELDLFNPLLLAQRFKELKEFKPPASKEKTESEKAESDKAETEEAQEAKIVSQEEIAQTADRYQKQNYELNAKTLLILRTDVKPEDDVDTVLAKVQSVYKDAALADEALDFLIETSSGKARETAVAAKAKFNGEFEREIKAGRNIGQEARTFSKEGLGSPTALRDLYRDITGNPREPLALFDELTDLFRYPKMKSVINFLLHSLGADLKAKGPSIAPAELRRLIDETRSLQGILGVFRFFISRMSLIQSQFQMSGLTLPPQLDYELLAKLFIKMLAERFINPEKILATAKILGISQQVAAQIIVYTQMRDAIRQVAPRYYRNKRHKDEFQKAFLDALEELEDDLEDEEEGQE